MAFKIIYNGEYFYVEIFSCKISAAVVAGEEIMAYKFDYMYP